MPPYAIGRFLLVCLIAGVSVLLAPLRASAQDPQPRATLTGHTDVVYGVAFSPDQKTLASASQDQTIRFWDVATGKEKAVLKGHKSWVSSVAFNRDGSLLASGSATMPGEVKLWDVATAKESETV